MFNTTVKGNNTILASNFHEQIDVSRLDERDRLRNADMDWLCGKSEYESRTGVRLQEIGDAGFSEGTYARLFKTKDGKRVFVISGKYW